jgi:hypothetical protein
MEQAIFASHVLSWGGINGCVGVPGINDVPSLLGPHM